MGRNQTTGARRARLATCLAIGAAACTFGADPDPRKAVLHMPRPSWAAARDDGLVTMVAPVEVSIPAAAPAGEMAVRDATPAGAPRAIAVGKNAGHAIDEAIERAFASTCDECTFAWLRSNDRDAVDHLLLGRAEFGVISGRLSPREVNAGLRQTRLGVELFALVVAPGSPVVSLTRSQMRQVLTGQVTDWGQLGHRSEAIVVVVPTDRLVAERAAHTLIPGDDFTATAVRVPSQRHTADQILQHPGAVGVVRLCGAPLEAGQKLLQIDWFSPTLDAFDYGTYPFGQALQLITSGPATGLGQRFLAFARTSAGRDLFGRSLLLP
ncbi:MAG TPA: substrate-binding domain-containing protein [Planctomycetota bacterium]|nr:substrate-binding domain-containing protein [Planctomycetota bacterium]